MKVNRNLVYMLLTGTFVLATSVAYFLNLPPFSSSVELRTHDDIRAYLRHQGECQQVNFIEQLAEGLWTATCDIDSKIVGGRFWVYADGTIKTEADMIGF